MNWVPILAIILIVAAVGLGLFTIWALCCIRSREDDRMDERIDALTRRGE